MDSTLAINLRGADAQRGASGRVVRWMQKTVRSLRIGELGLVGVVESEPEYQTKAISQAQEVNGCKVIRGFGSQIQSTRHSLHQVYVDEGGLGIWFPSRAAMGSRVRMSRR